MILFPQLIDILFRNKKRTRLPMFTIINEKAQNKMRDIEIAIEVESGRNLKDVGDDFDLDKESVRKIHEKILTALLKQQGKYYDNCAFKINRSKEQLNLLKEYKSFLADKFANGMD